MTDTQITDTQITAREAVKAKQAKAKQVQMKVPVGKSLGMSLAFKFAVMVSCMVALIMGVYSTIIGVSTWNALENGIKLRGVAQAQMLALFGKRIIEQAELEDDIEDSLRDVGFGQDTIEKAINVLHIPDDYLKSISELPSKTESIASEIVEAVIMRPKGKIWERVATIHGKDIRSLPGVKTRCVLRMGSEIVEVDVMKKEGMMSIGSETIPVIEFVKVIENNDGEKIGEARLVLSKTKVVEAKNRLMITMLVGTAAAVGAAIVTSLILASVVTRPVRQLVRDMAIVSGGNLDHRTLVRSRDEIGLLSRTFNDMTKGLAAAQAAVVERQVLARDLSIAREIQQKLLPEKLPSIPGYDISAFYKSAKDIGGDYYDFIPIDRHHIGMIVADVSGKGIPGSMVMTMTRMIVRFEAQRNPSPADTLKKVNRILSREIRRGMFVTAFYLILDVSQRTITFSSAGHNPMIFVRNETGKQWILNPGGIALGFDKGEVFNSTIEEEKLRLRKGDRIVLYTDGVVEAMNARKEQFGEKRFYNLAGKKSRQSSDIFVKDVVDELERHRGNADQHDDITISTFMLS